MYSKNNITDINKGQNSFINLSIFKGAGYFNSLNPKEERIIPQEININDNTNN